MISPTAVEMLGNELLAKLNESDRQRLAAHMMVFELNRKDILQPAGEDVVDTWFPCGPSLASYQLWSEDGVGAVEVALIGREGAIGGIVSNGSLPAYANAVVRVGGPFFRLKTAALEQAKLNPSPCATGSRAIRIVCSRRYFRLPHATRPTPSCSAPPNGCSRRWPGRDCQKSPSRRSNSPKPWASAERSWRGSFANFGMKALSPQAGARLLWLIETPSRPRRATAHN